MQIAPGITPTFVERIIAARADMKGHRNEVRAATMGIAVFANATLDVHCARHLPCILNCAVRTLQLIRAQAALQRWHAFQHQAKVGR